MTGCAEGALTVWESTGWGHGRTLCAQAAGQRLPMGGGYTHTAEETATGGETKCMIPSVEKSDCAAREDIALAQAALGHGWGAGGRCRME